MAISYTTLFTRLGKIFHVQNTINTSRGTTLPPLFLDILDEFDGAGLDLKRAVGNIESANRSLQSGGSGAMSATKQAAANVVIETVDADTYLSARTLSAALAELIRQMVADSESVDASTVAATVAANSGNTTNAVFVVSAKRPDGLAQENLIAETVRGLATSETSLQFLGDVGTDDKLSESWPAGSGSGRTVTVTEADSSLLENGSFDSEEDVANAPDDWIVGVGTIGTTLKMTDYEVQELVVTGPPTAGTYLINWTNQASKVQTTAPLAYNATGDDVQAALRLLEGLEEVVVTTTGTTPLFTHSLEFTGVAGNLSQITVTNSTTGGTYTPGTTTAGTTYAMSGKALELDSDGAELTAIYRRVTLEALKQYAFNLWAATDSAPAAGVITVDLVDGIGGSVIADQAGTNNSFTIDCTTLTTSFVAKNGVFRIPKVLPPIVFLRIRITTAVSNTSSIFLDEAALIEMTALYAGGPSAAAFAGTLALYPGDAQVSADGFTITTTNNGAGAFQRAFERNFDMAAKGLLLPSNAGGTETISDSLIG